MEKSDQVLPLSICDNENISGIWVAHIWKYAVSCKDVHTNPNSEQ